METKINQAFDDETVVEFEVPSHFKVIFLNDDFTTMEFVVGILMGIFKKSAEDAEKIMADVHKNGKGIAGVYPYDIAATKATMAMKAARDEGFPLRIVLEKE